MNAVQYAEEELGVHEVWQSHNDAIHNLLVQRSSVDGHKATIRSLKEQMVDREFDLLSDLMNIDPDASATARNQVLKRVSHTDSLMGELRKDLATAESDLATAETVLRVTEAELRGTAARMEQLAGLLRFYAVSKEATLHKSNEHKEQSQ
jgi:hypothetical protein